MKLPVTNHTHQNQFCGSQQIPRYSTADVDIDIALKVARQQHMYPALSADLSMVADDLAFEEADGTMNLAFCAPIHTQTGYGHFAAMLTKYLLRDQDILLSMLAYQRKAGGPDMPSEVSAALAKDPVLCRVGVLMNFPWRHHSLHSPYKVHVGFYETTELGERWVKSTNDGLNEVWVFSGFCKELFSRCVEIPVYQMHGGYDPEEYWYADRRGGKFKFGIAGRLTGRKGVGRLQQAFLKEFHGNDDVELHIKTREFALDDKVTLPDGSHSQVDPDFETSDDPRIHYHYGDWTVQQMREFYQGLDVFCFPSHGEGLGLEPLEAMACGAATIVTDWSGMADYADQDYCYPIQVNNLEPASKQMVFGGGHWADVDFGVVGDLMSKCYKDGCKEIGERAARAMESDWTIEHGADSVKQRLFALASEL